MGIVTQITKTKTAISGDSNRRQVKYLVRGGSLTQSQANDLTGDNLTLYNSGIFTIGELTDVNIHALVRTMAVFGTSFLGTTLVLNHGGIPLSHFEFEHQRDLEPEVWIITAIYEELDSAGRDRDPADPDSEFQWDWDVSTTTQRVKRSLKDYVDDVTAFAPGIGDIPVDQKGAINRSPDNWRDVEGVEIEYPAVSFSITHTVKDGWFIPDRIAEIGSLVGKVNSDDYNQYAAGEVLFVGVTGRINQLNESQIVYRFKARRNRLNVPIEGTALLIPKIEGWQYTWDFPALEVQANQGDWANTVAAIYVADVYEKASFATLPVFPFVTITGTGDEMETGDGNQPIP